MKKSYFLVEIESEYEISADTLEQNIYSRFPTSVESVKVEAAEQGLHLTGGTLRGLPAVFTLEDGTAVKISLTPPARK